MGIKNMEAVDSNTVIQTVEIIKRPGQTLGFYIREGNGVDRHEGVFISRIAMGSVVENNGLLRVGDEIMSVNDADITKVGLDDVVVLMSIPKRLILKIRTSRSSTKNASCPSLSTLDQDEAPPVVVVKKCRSASVDPDRNSDDIDERYGHAFNVGSARDRSRQLAGEGEINVDAALQNMLRGGDNTPPAFPISARRPRPRFARDYVDVNFKARDYSSDSDVGRSYYEREPPHSLNMHIPFDRTLDLQRQLINDYEQHYGQLVDKNKKLQKLISNAVDCTLAYNSDSEVVFRKRHPSGANALSDSETEVDDERCNSLPRMDGGESSDEIRHWLRKFDTLANDLSDETASKEQLTERTVPVPEALHVPSATAASTAGRKETYTSEEYSSWIHTKSPSFQRKLSATPDISLEPRPRITRQYSADASSFPRPDYADVGYGDVTYSDVGYGEVTREQHLANLQALSKQQAAKLKSLGLKSRVPDGEIPKNLPHYISRIRDLQLTRKPVQIRLDEYQNYRTERRTRRLPDEKFAGLDGILSCHVSSGHGLKSSNTMLRDLYCIVEIDTINKARTMIRTGAINFDWDELFEIELENARELTFLVYNWDPQARHKLCFYGVANLPILMRTATSHKIALRLEPKGILYFDVQYLEPAVSLRRQPSAMKNALFGVDLETIIRREKTGLRVPLAIKKCIDEVDRRGLDVVGIYRLCGSAKRKLQMREEFVKNPRAVDLSTENVSDINVVTGILKDFLRELPDPLFTNSLYQMLVDSITIRRPADSSSHKLMMGLLDCLPKANQDTMVMLMNHLKRVIAKCDVNKMNSQNLAVCFGPLLLCPSPNSINDVAAAMDFKKHVDVLRYLLDIWPEITRETQKILLERSMSMDRTFVGSEKVTSPKSAPAYPDQTWITETAAHNRMYVTHHESIQVPHRPKKQSDAYAEVRPRVKSSEESHLESRPRGRNSDDYVEIRRFKIDPSHIQSESDQHIRTDPNLARAHPSIERKEVELPPDPRRQLQLEHERMRRHQEEMDIRRHRIEEEARRQLAEHDARVQMEEEQKRLNERSETQRLQAEARRQAEQAAIRRENTELETRRLQAEARRQAEQAELRRQHSEQENRRKAEEGKKLQEQRRIHEQEVRRQQADNELLRQQAEQERRQLIEQERRQQAEQERRKQVEQERRQHVEQEHERRQHVEQEHERRSDADDIDRRRLSDHDPQRERAEQALRREMAEHLARRLPEGEKRQAPPPPPGRCEPEGQNGDRESPPKMDGRRSPGVGHLRPEPDGHHGDKDSKSPNSSSPGNEREHLSITANLKQDSRVKPALPPKSVLPDSYDAYDRLSQRSRQRKVPPPVPPKPQRSRSSSQGHSS